MWKTLSQLNTHIHFNPASEAHGKIKASVNRDIVTKMFTAELFEVAKNLVNHTSTTLKRINLLCGLT